jgi:hypothetical protein
MSRLFGPLRQMGFVVRDIDRAMQHWIAVRAVGPWFVAEKLPLDGFWYKEQPAGKTGNYIASSQSKSSNTILETTH